MLMMCECLHGRQKKALQLLLHTYMNDVWIGVPVISADKKVHQKLSSIFFIQLGNDILQSPRLAWSKEKHLRLRNVPMSITRLVWQWKRTLYHNWFPSYPQLLATRTHQEACWARESLLSAQSNLKYRMKHKYKGDNLLIPDTFSLY